MLHRHWWLIDTARRHDLDVLHALLIAKTRSKANRVTVALRNAAGSGHAWPPVRLWQWDPTPRAAPAPIACNRWFRAACAPTANAPRHHSERTGAGENFPASVRPPVRAGTALQPDARCVGAICGDPTASEALPRHRGAGAVAAGAARLMVTRRIAGQGPRIDAIRNVPGCTDGDHPERSEDPTFLDALEGQTLAPTVALTWRQTS